MEIVWTYFGAEMPAEKENLDDFCKKIEIDVLIEVKWGTQLLKLSK